jgi:hypothetical protein
MTNDLIVTFFEGTVTTNEIIDTFFGGGGQVTSNEIIGFLGWLVTSSEIIVIFKEFFNEITK